MHEKRFNREIERLRDPERVARLEVDRVASLILSEFNGVTSVLDVGTGSGLFAEKFAEHGLSVSGVDANPEMIPAAGQFVPSGDFHEGIAEKLPFEDESFDLVFMGLLLHETDNTPEAIKEAYRVTRRGLAILEWPYEAQLFGPPMEHRLSPETVNTLAIKAGFGTARAVRLNSLILYLYLRD